MKKFIQKQCDNSKVKALFFLIFLLAIFTIMASYGNGASLTYAQGTEEFEMGFVCTDKTDTSIILSWNQYEGEGIYHYNLLKNDVSIVDTTENSYIVSGLNQDTNYKFKLQILDENNNVIKESIELNEKTARILNTINYNEDNIETLIEDVYILTENLTIPEGKTLEVEAGATIKLPVEQQIVVNGNLLLNGTQEKNINITSVTGKWNNIWVSETGNLEASYTILNNSGRAKWENSETIVSSGTIKLNNIEIGDTALKEQIVATGKIAEITNSKLAKVLKLYDLESCKIENNEINLGMSISNISNVESIKNNTTKGWYYPITFLLTNYNPNIFENIENNHNIEDENCNGIYLEGELVSDLKLVDHNVYIVNGLTIPEGKTLEVEAGATIKLPAEQQILVNGNLLLNGTQEKNINITSVTGKWNNIWVSETGNLEASYTILNNSGRSKWENSETIVSSGTIKLNNIEIGDTALKEQIVATGKRAEITNSKLAKVLKLYDLESCKIENNEIDLGITISNISNVESIKNNITKSWYYPITLDMGNKVVNIFENIENNQNLENANGNGIYLAGTLTSDLKLTSNNQYILNDLTIPEGNTLEVEAGTTIKIHEIQKILVEGNLLLKGTADKRTTLTSVQNKWKQIQVNATGNLEASYITIINAGSSSWYDTEAIISFGKIKLDNIEIGTLKLAEQILATGKSAEITNSKFSKTLKLYDLESCKIENNEIDMGITISNISNVESIKNNTTKGTNYPITLNMENREVNIFQNVENNHNIENENCDGIYLAGTLVSDLKCTINNKYILNDLVIPEGKILEMEEGTTFIINNGKKLEVSGLLYINGTINKNVELKSNNSGYWNGIIIKPEGQLISNNANITFAGANNCYAIQNSGKAIIVNNNINNIDGNRAILYETNNPEQILKYNAILGNVTSNINLDGSYNYWGQ